MKSRTSVWHPANGTRKLRHADYSTGKARLSMNHNKITAIIDEVFAFAAVALACWGIWRGAVFLMEVIG